MAEEASNLKILELDGEPVPLAVKRHARARRLTLRLDPASGRFHLVLPRGVPLREGLDFARRRSTWILHQLGSLPPRVPFADGAVIPLLGRPHRIEHRPTARGAVWREAEALCVAGSAEHLPRRVGDYLKKEARAELGDRARQKSRRVGRRIARVSLRDTQSRWGSCSRDGRINFSWRLILAPESVLDYVVAHEVAHLIHMDHSREFWRLVDRLTADVPKSKAWLRRHGAGLLRYGGSSPPYLPDS